MDAYDFTFVDAFQYFGEREIKKAQPYLDYIMDLSIDAQRVTATVKGTAARPYTVVLNFERGTLSSTCSCPVGFYCKHSAAVALATLKHRVPNAGTSVRSKAQRFLDELNQTLHPKEERSTKSSPYVLIWKFALNEPWKGPSLRPLKSRVRKDGSFTGAFEEWSNFQNALRSPPAFVSPEDQQAIKLLLMGTPSKYTTSLLLPLSPMFCEEVIKTLSETRRLYFEDVSIPLTYVSEIPATLKWDVIRTGEQIPTLHQDEHPLETFAVGDILFGIDTYTHVVGPIRSSDYTKLLNKIIKAPPLNAVEAKQLRELLSTVEDQLSLPLEDPLEKIRNIKANLEPIATFSTGPAHIKYGYSWQGDIYTRTIDYVHFEFRYDEIAFEIDDKYEIAHDADKNPFRVKRDLDKELALTNAIDLSSLGYFDLALFEFEGFGKDQVIMGLQDEQDWEPFVQDELPKLSAAGWKINIDPSFRHYKAPVSQWYLDITPSEDGWLDVELGIDVQGKRLDLKQLLLELFSRDRRWLDPNGLSRVNDDETIVLRPKEGAQIAVAASRLKPIVGTLVDLFSRKGSPALRLSRFDATRAKELASHFDLDEKGLESVIALTQSQMPSFGIKEITVPRSLDAQLRTYQTEGVAWLQFLRENNLGGILADDMGLGKTLQALTHILIEKESGRLKAPVLVILPTSLIHTWQSEAKKFTPTLSVLTLHGSERQSFFSEIAKYDLVLTTYPLIWRDIEKIRSISFHTVILDEAQYVKNAASKSANAIRKLTSNYRLALTGTPIENHLSELWAQFDFLLPGFLGDKSFFKEVWATPIETHGDTVRLSTLSKRLRPFILRRAKSDVAQELPPKTIVVRPIDIDGTQRDLYESVRATMDKRIRDEVARRGLERSQIIVLDALLKLRQVCCDPRLLKSQSAKSVAQSAKHDALLEMVQELLAEGRRILVFSQFTEMLDLIGTSFRKHGIDYVELRGDTKDRVTPVSRFQNLEVPVFLISLKAGGVGLTLTAADTVIHYDPWWNPAAEDQATDRTHRIGQDKPVFVYKLIVAGSIEEKIVKLQQQKAELASGILDEAKQSGARFTPEDLENLLAPLPGTKKRSSAGNVKYN